ncbi:unnamed protein product, partial [Didymodactylos carnosus]
IERFHKHCKSVIKKEIVKQKKSRNQSGKIIALFRNESDTSSVSASDEHDVVYSQKENMLVDSYNNHMQNVSDDVNAYVHSDNHSDSESNIETVNDSDESNEPEDFILNSFNDYIITVDDRPLHAYTNRTVKEYSEKMLAFMRKLRMAKSQSDELLKLVNDFSPTPNNSPTTSIKLYKKIYLYFIKILYNSSSGRPCPDHNMIVNKITNRAVDKLLNLRMRTFRHVTKY